MIDRTSVMTESNTDADQDALDSWMLPHKILIAKVWEINQDIGFVWSISIDKFIADYVAGSLAPTPREAARDFSLKWQMPAGNRLYLQTPLPKRMRDGFFLRY